MNFKELIDKADALWRELKGPKIQQASAREYFLIGVMEGCYYANRTTVPPDALWKRMWDSGHALGLEIGPKMGIEKEVVRYA